MIDADELGAWLRLLTTRGLGRAAARQLLAGFGSPQAAVGASRTALAAVAGTKAADLLAAPDPDLAALMERTLAWLRDDPGGRDIVTLGDARYPPALLHTADPPLLLHAQGRLDVLLGDALAIVGSRQPTEQGRDNARAFARELARDGWVVVSGLALGVDAAAHEGALQGEGATVAVVGTGLDRVYPARHRDLAHRIAANGLLLSELPLGAPPLAQHFPSRNRIIAGLSLGTLVVEAAVQSGSLVTARLAAEAGREVFAIPGSIHAPQSRGCHALIKQGAKLVECADDVRSELARLRTGSAPAAPAAPPDAEAGDSTDPRTPAWLQAMGWDPVALDALQARTGLPTPELSARLLELELGGLVARLPGGLYQRRRQA